ncbi:MAG: hypothetical protein V2I36_03885 [Desulfopila sp.]|jgi:DNA-binding IclR family transcriptional regulator|nr:hypothetical protein [Desulfopila sp.]
MSTLNKKIDILTILYKNLQTGQPQLVPSSTIAGEMNLNHKELHQLLKSMEGMGVIETDPDLQFNLITAKGVTWLNQQNPEIR